MSATQPGIGPGWWQASDGKWYPPEPSASAPTTDAAFLPRYQYDAEVDKKSINMGRLTQVANARGADGWRLPHAFEQDGNTILIWKRPLP